MLKVMEYGEIITSPTSFHLSFTVILCFDCTNNMAEYEACIYEIEAAIDLRIKILQVYRDFSLVISQVKEIRKLGIAS